MSDQIQRFLFDRTNVRGEIVSLEQAYQDVLDRHRYPSVVNHLLGELLAAVALLTDTVKLDGTLSIEVRGKGALALLMAESNPGGELRAIARMADDTEIPANDMSFHELIGDGQIMITLDPAEGQRYQGIVALEHNSLAECLEAYFAQSEQLPTRLWLAASDSHAGGLLLQRLPDGSQNQDDDAWGRTVQLAATLTTDELLGLEQRDMLYRLYHDETVRVYEPKSLRFACTCSRRRIGEGLLTLGEAELREVLAEQGSIETQCHFCHSRYRFSPADVEALLVAAEDEPPVIH
ncbi:Hsp33 family molecular chaperone HslO [Halomonas sp. TRM85114]|uniref:Hsp33 family molecular chaperone HslO n=1 Tax=Halomonas jincaotanensis TaxID=2810616 RepID=UPI001BD6D19B|nr:Hsp33 family molecular chaperone HslO [Halomonas jincaotanensis]MBS9402958.1 Hsp33 family molecular chaperone HslO [Halomonas jincaotanensis]